MADLTSNANLSAFHASGKLRFECDDTGNAEKRFVVSEDCATTDAGVTAKSILDLENVATHIAALTDRKSVV